MNDGSIRIGTELETKTVDAQIKELENKLETMVKTLETDAVVDFRVRMSNEEKLKLQSDIEKTKNRILSLKSSMEEVGETSDNTNNRMSKGFQKSTNTIKKFMFRLISVASIYSLVSKASQSYLATDQKTTSQLEANWVGLGTILEPVIKFLIDLMKQAVTGVLHFMSVLTGVDYIAKANANALKKQTQATKDLNKANDKLTASFDEMNVLNDTKATGGTSSGIDRSALFDVNDLGENVKETIEKIATALKPVYDFLKEIIEWALDNPEAVIGILGGLGLISFLAKVIGVAGVGGVGGTGLAGILGILTAIMAIGTIVISIKTIVDAGDQLKETSDKSTESIKSGNKAIKEYNALISDKDKLEQADTETLKRMKNGMKMLTESTLGSAESERQRRIALQKNIALVGPLVAEIGGLNKEYENSTKALEDNVITLYDSLGVWQQYYEMGKLNKEEQEQYKQTLEKFRDILLENVGGVDNMNRVFQENKEETKVLRDMYTNVVTNLKNMETGFYNASEEVENYNETLDKVPNSIDTKVNVETSSAKTKLQNLLNTLSTSFNKVFNSTFSLFGIDFKLPKLATGGIINNPGRGIPLGGAIGGEVSAEGVIPLTDSQAMETLGATIGKYININATIPVYMGTRQIQREIKKINSESDFASNS